MSVAVIVPAAGSGRRMGGDKLAMELAGRPMLERTLAAVADSGICDRLIVVAPRSRWREVRRFADAAGLDGRLTLVEGGARRQDSVRRGLEACGDAEVVCVHDAARPLCPRRLFVDCLAAARRHGAATTAVPLVDSVKRVDPDGRVVATVPRADLVAVQTPQAFRADLLREAHRRAAAEGWEADDDCALVELLGVTVVAVAGDPANLKVTRPADVVAAAGLLSAADPRTAPVPVARGAAGAAVGGTPRIGHGIDAHRLVAGRPLWLGGVRIESEVGLEGHSDGDAAAHALGDAVLGAAGLGDLGRHFPSGEERWRGVSGVALLAEVARLVRERGFVVDSAQVVVVAERPRLAGHAAAMARAMAGALGAEPDRVAVSASTADGLGFVGRGEGIAASAVALVVPVAPVS